MAASKPNTQATPMAQPMNQVQPTQGPFGFTGIAGNQNGYGITAQPQPMQNQQMQPQQPMQQPQMANPFNRMFQQQRMNQQGNCPNGLLG